MQQPPDPYPQYPQQQSPMPPQQPQYPHYQRTEPQFAPPVPPPAPKKSGKGKFATIGCLSLIAVIALVIVILVAFSAGQSNQYKTDTQPLTQLTTQPSQQTTQAPAKTTGKWTTTHTFSGNGIQKTAVFTVPDDFKLIWKCDPSSDYFGQYNVIVELDAPDGSYVGSAVNTICKAGNTSGSTEIHGDAGQVYLDMNSEDAWTIQIQVLK